MPKKTADIALGKRKKAKGGSYKEHEEYKEKTRPVTILDMTPVKGEVMEAGMGGARKAAVKMARKMMQKMKGSKKASQTDANKATERLKATQGPAGIKYDDLGRMSNEQLTKRLDEAINWSKKNEKFPLTDKDIAAQFKQLTGQSIKDLRSGKFDMNKRVVDSKGLEIPVMGDKAKDGLYEVINLLYGVM